MADEPVSLEEIARDLLDARNQRPRHIGFRLDLWECLRVTLADHAATLPPRIAALPLEAQNAYRVLRKAGYVLGLECGTPTYEIWTPPGEPMTSEAMYAFAELQEYGLAVIADA